MFFGFDAIVEIPAVIIAMALLLMLYASRNLFEPFALWLASFLGPFASAISDAIRAKDLWFADQFEALADAGVTALAVTIAAPPIAMTQLVDVAIALLTSLVHAITATAQGITDAVTSATIALVNQAIALLRTDVDTIFNVGLPNLQWFMEQVQAELWAAYNNLSARVGSIEQSLGASIEQAVRDAVGALGATIEAVRSELLAAVYGIEAGINERIGALGVAIDGQIQAIGVLLGADVSALRAALAAAIPGLETKITAAELAAAAALALVAAEAAVATKWIHDCGEPLCTHFGPDIPFLETFATLLTSGLVAAWIAEAVSNPEGTADFTAGLVAGPVNTVTGALSSLA